MEVELRVDACRSMTLEEPARNRAIYEHGSPTPTHNNYNKLHLPMGTVIIISITLGADRDCPNRRLKGVMVIL